MTDHFPHLFPVDFVVNTNKTRRQRLLRFSARCVNAAPKTTNFLPGISLYWKMFFALFYARAMNLSVWMRLSKGCQNCGVRLSMAECCSVYWPATNFMVCDYMRQMKANKRRNENLKYWARLKSHFKDFEITGVV